MPGPELRMRGDGDEGAETRRGRRPSAYLLLREADGQVRRVTKEEGTMESLKMSLCPACTACPEVELAGDEVRIGEAGNLTVLKKDEWNVLVDLIQSGHLTKV